MPMAVLRNPVRHDGYHLEPHIRRRGRSGWIDNMHWRGPRKFGFWFTTAKNMYLVRWSCKYNRIKLQHMGYEVLFHTGGGNS